MDLLHPVRALADPTAPWSQSPPDAGVHSPCSYNYLELGFQFFLLGRKVSMISKITCNSCNMLTHLFPPCFLSTDISSGYKYMDILSMVIIKLEVGHIFTLDSCIFKRQIIHQLSFGDNIIINYQLRIYLCSFSLV